MPIELSKPIADYVEANARRDVDGMLSPRFALEDGAIKALEITA